MSARLILIVIIFSFLTTIALAQGTLAPGFYDDTSANINYTGSVGQIDLGCCTSFYNHTYTEARQVEFTFNSTGFTVYGQKNSGTPDIYVCIDVDALCLYTNFSPFSNGYIGALFTVDNLSLGTHTATFYANPNNLFYLNNYVPFDAFEIHSLPIPTATNTPIPTNTAVPTATNTPVPSATPDSPHLTIPIDAEDLESFFDWFRIIFGLVLPIALLGAGLTAGAVFAFALGRIFKKYIESLKDGS